MREIFERFFKRNHFKKTKLEKKTFVKIKLNSISNSHSSRYIYIRISPKQTFNYVLIFRKWDFRSNGFKLKLN